QAAGGIRVSHVTGVQTCALPIDRSRARWRVLIAGRGAGKTHAAAKELLDLIGAAPPNSEAAVLAPTLTHAEAAQRALTELCAPRSAERRVGSAGRARLDPRGGGC